MLLKLFILLCAASLSFGHMHLNDPPPLNAANNPFTEGNGEAYIDNPYGCCGKPMPGACHGQLNLLGTKAGSPVASWEAGSAQKFSLGGKGNHYGGSCQIGFSVDNGTTFQVATSYEGNCPHRKGGMEPDGQTFDFKVPKDIPAGEAIFAWTWVNREQEFFMNCAVVTITGSSQEPAPPSYPQTFSDCTCTCDGTDCSCECPGKPKIQQAHVSHNKRHNVHSKGRAGRVLLSERTEVMSYFDRPKMLFVNVGNGCSSPKNSAELKYPHPGPELVSGDGEYRLNLPSPFDKCGDTQF